MSKQTIISCNRCGVEISPYCTKEESAQIKLWAPGEYRASGGQRIDLCLTCYEAFINFLESSDINE